MTAADMNTIRREVQIQAPRARVWRALVTEGEFAKWFSVVFEGRFEAGQRIKMTSTHPKGQGASFFVTVVEIQAERLFSWSWHPGMAAKGADHSKEAATLVAFRLEDTEGGTLVTVTESGFDRISLERRAKAFADNSEGWEIQMAALDRYVRAAD